VVSVLRRTIPRDLRRHRWQYVAIGATVAIGVALFAASNDAFTNLEASYARTYERLAFADMTVTGGDVTGFVEQARGGRRGRRRRRPPSRGRPDSDRR
jgi:putative ABC transport system permease protein